MGQRLSQPHTACVADFSFMFAFVLLKVNFAFVLLKVNFCCSEHLSTFFPYPVSVGPSMQINAVRLAA